MSSRFYRLIECEKMTVEAASKDANLYVLDVYACDRTTFSHETHQGESNGDTNDDTLSAGSDVEVSEVDFIAS